MSGLAAPLAVGVLAVPGLQLATAISFVVAAAVLLLSLAASSRDTANALLRCVIVQGVLLIAAYDCTRLAGDLSQRLIEVVSSAPDAEASAILSWVESRQQRANLGLRHLFGPFIGYVLLIVVSGLTGKQGPSFESPVRSAESGYPDLPDAALPAAVSPGPPQIPVPAAPPGDLIQELQHPAFAIRSATSTLFSYIPGPKPYEIFALNYDPKDPLLFRAMVTGRATHIVRPDGGTVIEIRPGNRGAFSVFGENQQPLGGFRRDGVLRAAWALTDPTGIHLGDATRVQVDIRRVGYALEIGGRTACRLTWRVYTLFRYQMEVEFLVPSDLFDRRLGLALGVILESKTRFRAHAYSN